MNDRDAILTKLSELEDEMYELRQKQILEDFVHQKELRNTARWSPEYAKANKVYIRGCNDRAKRYAEVLNAMDDLCDKL